MQSSNPSPRYLHYTKSPNITLTINSNIKKCEINTQSPNKNTSIFLSNMNKMNNGRRESGQYRINLVKNMEYKALFDTTTNSSLKNNKDMLRLFKSNLATPRLVTKDSTRLGSENICLIERHMKNDAYHLQNQNQQPHQQPFQQHPSSSSKKKTLSYDRNSKQNNLLQQKTENAPQANHPNNHGHGNGVNTNNNTNTSSAKSSIFNQLDPSKKVISINPYLICPSPLYNQTTRLNSMNISQKLAELPLNKPKPDHEYGIRSRSSANIKKNLNLLELVGEITPKYKMDLPLKSEKLIRNKSERSKVKSEVKNECQNIHQVVRSILPKMHLLPLNQRIRPVIKLDFLNDNENSNSTHMDNTLEAFEKLAIKNPTKLINRKYSMQYPYALTSRGSPINSIISMPLLQGGGKSPYNDMALLYDSPKTTRDDLINQMRFGDMINEEYNDKNIINTSFDLLPNPIKWINRRSIDSELSASGSGSISGGGGAGVGSGGGCGANGNGNVNGSGGSRNASGDGSGASGNGNASSSCGASGSRNASGDGGANGSGTSGSGNVNGGGGGGCTSRNVSGGSGNRSNNNSNGMLLQEGNFKSLSTRKHKTHSHFAKPALDEKFLNSDQQAQIPDNSLIPEAYIANDVITSSLYHQHNEENQFHIENLGIEEPQASLYDSRLFKPIKMNKVIIMNNNNLSIPPSPLSSSYPSQHPQYHSQYNSKHLHHPQH